LEGMSLWLVATFAPLLLHILLLCSMGYALVLACTKIYTVP